MELKNQILKALGLSDEKISLEYQAKLIDGTIVVSTKDTLDVGCDIAILAEDGSMMKLPAGSYELEDGTIFTVEEEGIIATMGTKEEIETEEKEEYQEEEAPAEDVAEEAVTEVVEEVVDATEEIAEAINEATPEEVTPEIAKQAAEIAVAIVEEKAEEVALSTEMQTVLSIIRKELNTIKGKNRKLEIEKNTLSTELEKVSKEPASEPVTTNKFSKNATKEISSKDYRNMTRQEKYWYNINKNK